MDKLGDDPCNTHQTAAPAPGDQVEAKPARADARARRCVNVASQPAVLEPARSPLMAISTFRKERVSATPRKSGDEQDFADVAAVLDMAMSGGRLRERE